MVKLRFLKIIFLVLIFGFLTIGSTNSSFLDTESSSNNSFFAGSVDFSLTDGDNFTDIKPGFNENKTIKINKDGSLDFKYTVDLVYTGGDTSFCNALNISLPAIQPLTITGSQDDVNINISFTDTTGSLQNKSCSFSFVFKAWQLDSDGAWGLRDEEVLSNSITSGIWDTTPPVISDISHLIATPGITNQPVATITWVTDELATSNLDWRTSSSDPWTHTTIDTSVDNTSHTRTIDNLVSETTYYYKVISTDSAGNESVSDEKSFHTGDTRPGIPVLSDVVINEFLPNPIGADNAPRPGGEWVELYNNSSTNSIPLMGWYLKSASGNRLYLTNANTTSMSIAPHGFVVVYRDGNSSFSLRNSALGDILSLRDNNGYIRDLHTYSFILGDEVIENKSFARFPDGSATWFDPIPTPNGANILDPELSFSITGDRHFASFSLKNIDPFVSVSYELIYSTDGPDQGLIESATLDSQSEYTKENLLLGSCSTGGTCTYHSGVNNLHLTVKLKNTDGVETVLNKTIE